MVTSGKPQTEEIAAREISPVTISDPGDGGSVDVSRSGYVELTTSGAETRTLPDPTFRGQQLDIVFITDGGNCVITSSSAMNQTGNNTATFADVGDHQRLVGIADGPTDSFEWREIANDGVSLSTV